MTGDRLSGQAVQAGSREVTARTKHAVLCLGYMRGVWDGALAEDYRRLMAYGERLSGFYLVTHSYRSHGLDRRQLAPHVEAIPTDARGRLHSVARMVSLGWSVLRRHHVDIVQAQDPVPTGLIALILGRAFRRPVNVAVFGPNPYDEHWLRAHWTHRLEAPLARWVLRRAQGIQVDGQLTARRLIAAGHDHVRVKPVVPMNLEEFLALRRPQPSARATTRLLYVGRFTRQKNLGLLIQVARTLRAERAPAFEIRMVGDGPEAGRLRALIEREGLSRSVTLAGAVSRDRIAAVFGESDVLVLTSHYEGYPRVFMEAAAAAMPIVTTAVSGADEAVAHGDTGYIVPVGDAEAFSASVLRLLDDPSLRLQMGEAARRRVRRALDPRENARSQVAIWNELMAPRVRGRPVAAC